MTTWLSTSFRMQFRVIDGLQASAECAKRELRSSSAPGLRTFGHAYPGRPEQVRRVRADLEAILDGCPAADEVILVASELAANAVNHSSSRQPGGQFVVRAEVCLGDYVWVGVEDQGGAWAGYHPRDGRPHGLDIVQAIAGDGNWGIDGDATLGHLAWPGLTASAVFQIASALLIASSVGTGSHRERLERERAAEPQAEVPAGRLDGAAT